MTDLLLSMDSALFTFLNGTLGNPLFDVVMPVITDLNRHWYGWVLIGGAWVLLIVRGGRVGRTAALLVIPVIVISDQVTGFWAFTMDGFDHWNGREWGMPNISSAQDWDNGPEGAPKKAP